MEIACSSWWVSLSMSMVEMGLSLKCFERVCSCFSKSYEGGVYKRMWFLDGGKVMPTGKEGTVEGKDWACSFPFCPHP